MVLKGGEEKVRMIKAKHPMGLAINADSRNLANQISGTKHFDFEKT
jgi:hypothetical protein